MKLLPTAWISGSLLLLTMLISSATFGQERKNDLIIRRDSSKISCKVLVVSDQTVQYKKANDPEGPLFNVLKSDLARIVYGSGETEVFREMASRTVADNQGVVILHPVAPWRAAGFLENLPLWTPEELKAAGNFYKSNAKKSRTISIVIVSLGAAGLITGTILLSTRDRNNTYTSLEQRDQGVGAIVAGVVIGGVGGFVSNWKTKRLRRNAILVDEEFSKRKNSLGHLKIVPCVNPFYRSASVSIALKF